MSVIIKIVFVLAATLALSQGEETPTPEQEMLRSLQSLAASIESLLDQNMDLAAPKEKEAIDEIQASKSKYTLPNNIWRKYEVFLSSEIEGVQYKLRTKLCNQFQNFKKLIAQRPPVDRTLREWMDSAEYKSKTVSPHSEANVIAQFLRERYYQRSSLVPVPDTKSEMVDPAEKKRFFLRRIRDLTHANDMKMEAFEMGAKALLDAIFNAIVTASGMDRDLKGGLIKPRSVEEKAEVIQLALNIGDDLKCPRPTSN